MMTIELISPLSVVGTSNDHYQFLHITLQVFFSYLLIDFQEICMYVCWNSKTHCVTMISFTMTKKFASMCVVELKWFLMVVE
jgi:hypothetical protein